MHDPASARTLPPVPGLAVAAHTHGGQVWIPFHGSAVAPHGWPNDKTHGWVDVGGRPVYITSGLGVSIYPIRINMRPEWVMFSVGDRRQQ
jgi:predicted MPP superfamily phosphohydrolase